MKNLKKSFCISMFLLSSLSLAVVEAHANDGSYYKDHVNLSEAHKLTQGSADVTVALIGTGVNYRLEELAGKIVNDPETGAPGYDAIKDSGDPMDGMGVGTGEAGLIAGRTLGVAPGVKLVPIRMFDDHGGGTIVNLVKSIDYAIKRKVRIINAGLGGAGLSEVICEGLIRANAAGILVVMPAGNGGIEVLESDFPSNCHIENLVLVTSSDENKNLPPYANYSFRLVHTAAPSMNISVMDHTGQVNLGSGSSYATALVSGAAALVMSHHPEYTAAQVKEALIRGADATPSFAGKVASNGVLNIYKAMTVSLE